MIYIEAEFAPGDMVKALAAILTLPPPLKPTHFGDGDEEENKREPIEDESLFSRFQEKYKDIGISLYSKNIDCSFSKIHGQAISVKCNVTGENKIAEQILLNIAQASPLFAYACLLEERNYRNRIKIKQGASMIDSWVGRNIEKYIPGLYWWTVLSDSLMQKHDVPLDLLKASAREHLRLGGGLHMLRFYDRPEDWREASDVANLRLSSHGVFNVEKVRPRMEAAKTFLELIDVSSEWD